jgi:hypothetical protein
MKNYSIEKVGGDYVVKVDDQQVMKLGSRRRAAQLVVDASGLLDEVPLVPDAKPAMSGNAKTDDEAASTDDDPIDGGVMPLSITRDSPEVA